MRKLRVGIVGLGSIAQKAYLPILSKQEQWQLVGAFSPNQAKAQVVCDMYRITLFNSLDALAKQCDAVFVHSATSSHFSVIQTLLLAGVHVYVDKPLTEDISQSEQLIELAKKQQRSLMVGFNRRFAPFYVALKESVHHLASLKMEKHRTHSVGPYDVRFTLLDDYLHVVDTALWIAGGKGSIVSGHIQTTDKNELFYAEHHLQVGTSLVTTSMHRKAGSQQEQLTVIQEDAIHQITNMNQWRSENSLGIQEKFPANWDSILVQRGFDGAVRHFIDSVANQSQTSISGEEAIFAQRIIEEMLSQKN